MVHLEGRDCRACVFWKPGRLTDLSNRIGPQLVGGDCLDFSNLTTQICVLCACHHFRPLSAHEKAARLALESSP